jgi:hypothetical protein
MDGGDRQVTNSASHIKKYIEGTIERLGFAPDLYYLHRIDPSEWHQTFTSMIAVLITTHQIPPSKNQSQPSTQSAKPGRRNTSAYPNARRKHCGKRIQVRPLFSRP